MLHLCANFLYLFMASFRSLRTRAELAGSILTAKLSNQGAAQSCIGWHAYTSLLTTLADCSRLNSHLLRAVRKDWHMDMGRSFWEDVKQL